MAQSHRAWNCLPRSTCGKRLTWLAVNKKRYVSDATWASWHLKSSTGRSIVQQIVQAEEMTSKICITLPLWGNPLETGRFPSPVMREVFPFYDVITLLNPITGNCRMLPMYTFCRWKFTYYSNISYMENHWHWKRSKIHTTTLFFVCII